MNKIVDISRLARNHLKEVTFRFDSTHQTLSIDFENGIVEAFARGSGASTEEAAEVVERVRNYIRRWGFD
jgi:hypothetical protein